MTAKTEPAPISEERRAEIERECCKPCTCCGGLGPDSDGCPTCHDKGHEGRADPARIADYVDRQVEIALNAASSCCEIIKNTRQVLNDFEAGFNQGCDDAASNLRGLIGARNRALLEKVKP